MPVKNYFLTIKPAIAAGLCLIIAMAGSCSSSSLEKVPAKKEGIKESAVPAVYTVEIRQMKFSPQELSVKKGDKVNFINHDIVVHDVTETSRKAWSSSALGPNESWTFTAEETVDYYCSIHTVMKGRIIVK